MPTRETHRSLPEAWKYFDPSAFNDGDSIAFHNPRTNRWERGVLGGNVPVIDRDNRRIFLRDGAARGIELNIPPKRVDRDILNRTITLSIEDSFGAHTPVDYQVQRDASGNPEWNIGPDGEIEVNLVPATTTTAPNRQRIKNVNLEVIRSIREIEIVERAIDSDLTSLRGNINAINNIKRKELLAKVNKLDAEVHEMVKQMGHFDELGDISEEEVRGIAEAIKRLRNVAEDGEREIEADLRKIQAEIAARGVGDVARKRTAEGLVGRVDRRQTDAEKAWVDYDADQEKIRIHQNWEHEVDPLFPGSWAERRATRITEIAAWDAAAAAAGGGRRGGGRRPAEFSEKRPDEPPRPATPPIPSPTYSKEKALNAFGILEEMRTGTAALPPAPAAGAAPDGWEAHRFLIAETERKLAERKRNEGITGNYTPAELERRITGEIFLQVLEEWKNKDAKEPEAFDFDKEKKELDDKLKAIRERFDKLVLANPSFTTTTNIRDHIRTLGGFSKTTPDVETEMANLWRLVSTIEIDLFREEQRTAGRSEKEKEMDIDLPPNLLMDILHTRPGAVHEVMRHAYNIQLDGSGNESIVEALRQMFEPSPTQRRGRDADGNPRENEEMITRLRRYGIKDWRHFKKLWDEKLAPKAAELLHAVAQDDVRGEIARNASSWDNVRALGWQLGARIMTNLALVGGASLAVAATWASGGLAAVALAGATAGGVRAGLQKFLFGSKWLEGRKQKRLEELAREQRAQAITRLLQRRFGEHQDTAPSFTEGDAGRMFSALLATAAREASKDFVKDADAEGFGLQGDARRLYIQAIKDIRLGGDVPSAEQKQKCALAIKRIMERTAATVAEAAQGDPMVIRMLDGVLQGFSGANASKENYGLKGAATTVVAGSAAAMAFAADQWWARGVMGAIGGAAAGFHWGEGRRARQEREQARGQAEVLYNDSHEILLRVLHALETRRGTANRADLDTLTTNAQRLNRLLHGKFDSVAEQRMAQILAEEKTLRTQVEDLVYQTYRRGVFAARALGTLEDHARAIERQGEVPMADSTRAWWRKAVSRTAYTAGGAVAGAGLAILAGYGFQQAKEWMGIGVPQQPVSTETKAAVGTVAAAGGAAAGAENLPPSGGGSGHDVVPTGPKADVHDVTPTGSKGAEMHEVVVNKSPDYVAKSLDVYDIKKGGSAWGSIDHLQKTTTGKEVFSGWSKEQFAEWRQDELERLGYKFLPGGKIAHPYIIHPGAKMELYTGGDGDPHVRLVGLEDGKVRILDQYIVREATAKPLDITVPEVKLGQLTSPLKAGAIHFEAAFQKGGEDVISELPAGEEEKLMAGLGGRGRIVEVKAIGEAGLAAIKLEDGRSALVHPYLDKSGVWHIESMDKVPDVPTAIRNSQGIWSRSLGDVLVDKGGGYHLQGDVQFKDMSGVVTANYNDEGQLTSVTSGDMKLYQAGFGDRLPVGIPDHIDIKGGGTEIKLIQTGMDVDRPHLTDVLSGKGNPETVMAKGVGEGGLDTTGGKGATGTEAAETPKAELNPPLTKAEVVEYQSLLKGSTSVLKTELTSVINSPEHVYNNPEVLQTFVSKDIERVIAEAVKGVGNGQVSFELGQALSPDQSLPLDAKMELIRNALMDQLSPESKLLLGGGGSEYAMPVSTWDDEATKVFVAPGGSHLVAVELPSGKMEFVYSEDRTYYADGPGKQMIIERPDGTSYPAKLKLMTPSGAYSFESPVS